MRIEGVFAGGERPTFHRDGVEPILRIIGSGTSSIANVSISDSGSAGTTALELSGAEASAVSVQGSGGGTGVSLNRSTLAAQVFMGTGLGVLARVTRTRCATASSRVGPPSRSSAATS